MIRKIGLGLLAALAVGAALWGYSTNQPAKPTTLSAKLDQVVKVTTEPVLDCAHIAAQHPFVIMALGQSNAANHGELTTTRTAPVTLFTEGQCIKATDPLPGSTGRGGSIWSRLPGPLVISVMGIDATSIADWTDARSPLRQRLTSHIASMKTVGLLPTVILWQQGEADAKLGTTRAAYSAGLDKLANILTQAGTDAPIIMALSTVCRSNPIPDIRAAIITQAERDTRFKIGPDTDTLNDAALRVDGCHFSAAGLEQAARLWGKNLKLVFANI